MANLDPTSGTAKWVRNIGNATQSITDGVNAVTQAPGPKAAAQINVWLARIQQSAQKWAANVGGVSLASWQAAMIAGIPKIAAGANAKQGKYLAFATKFYPHLAQGINQVKSMPKGTLADAVSRATFMINWNASYAGRTS
ncbi:MAG TPA: hypothetical protein VGG32_08465 [Thermoplasmata archaeon]|jgi:hypothetical protein